MKQLLAWLAIALLGIVASACGSSGNTTPRTQSNAAVAGEPEDYADGDRDTKHKDDSRILKYGHPASAMDGRAIAELFKRYYTAAARGDGAIACSLYHPAFVRKLLTGYEQPSGRPPPRNETCATVASRLFDLRHYTLAIEVAKLRTLGARRAGDRGYELLRFETLTPETVYMPVRLKAGIWKINGLFCWSLI